MKKRCHALVAFPALLICIAMLSIGCTKKEEVTYQGKPLSEWIKMLEEPDPAAKSSAIAAIMELGPEAKEAAPAIIEMIRQVRNRDKRMLVACNDALFAMGKEAVPSCSIPLGSVGGRPITTLEGLGTLDKPHPLQQAFIAEQAAQCGYCTSGLIMTAKALLDRDHDPSETTIRR